MTKAFEGWLKSKIIERRGGQREGERGGGKKRENERITKNQKKARSKKTK